MASQQGIRAGGAFVELFADNGPLRKGLGQAKSYLQSWGKSLSTAGMAIIASDGAKVAAGIAAVFKTATQGRELLHMSESTGLAVEELADLGYAAERVGASVGDVSGAVQAMNNSLLQAHQGNTDVLRDLGQLGLSFDSLKNMSAADAFREVADALSKVQNESERARMAGQLLGGTYGSLAPLIRGGAAAIDEGVGASRRMGGGMTTLAAIAGDKFLKLWGEVKEGFMRVVNAVGTALMPALTSVLKWAVDILPKIVKFANENQGLISTVFIAAAAFTGLGVALVGLGTVFSVLATGVGIVGTIFGALVATLTFLFSPAGLLIAGVAAIAAIGGAMDGLGDLLGDLKGTFSDTFGSIVNAVKAGKLELAFTILTTGLKLVWLQLIDFLKSSWETLWTHGLPSVLERTRGYIAQQFNELGHSLAVLAHPDATDEQLIAWRNRRDARANQLRQDQLDAVRAINNRPLSPEQLQARAGRAAEIAALERELANLRAQAAAATTGGPTSGTTGGPTSGPMFGHIIDSVQAAIMAAALSASRSAVNNFSNTRQDLSSMGTFSGAQAAASAGGLSALEKLAIEQRDIQQGILDAVRGGGGLAFG